MRLPLPRMQFAEGRPRTHSTTHVMSKISKGLLAGLAATPVLSALMVMKALVLHIVFGAVPGWVYGKLLSQASGARMAHA